jgi:endonuclease-3 related protein
LSQTANGEKRHSSGGASAVRLRPSRQRRNFEAAGSGKIFSDAAAQHLPAYFQALYEAHGPQHWWPGRSRFEIIVGAILTQNTSWTNVERAIANLRRARLLAPAAIHRVSAATLARHLRPSGYFRQKTKTLKAFVGFLFHEYHGSLNRLFATATESLRDQLLGLRGIGPETADSILLYAGKRSVFVVDAYTRRILERHGLAQNDARYDEIRALFESVLPRDHQLFNEFHALIVQTGKRHCRKRAPLCHECPLSPFLPPGSKVSPQNSKAKVWRPLTSHESRVTDHGQQATNHEAPAAGCRPAVASS